VDILAASVGGELMTIESPLPADSQPGH
jgi:hypothetical protein